jgi:hypothetical protein
VIGVENDALIVADDDGAKYRIPVDEVLHSRIRQTIPERTDGRKLSPKEIQEQIRSGMSAEDVAAVTGMSVEYVQRYEGPILAEREHIVTLALDVPVHLAMDTGPVGGGMSFGTAIRSRLSAASAINERWASWKDSGSGWVVKLAFTANQIDHDARWAFDPKRLTLSPLNSEATTLSQQGDVPASLVPRLRAVQPTEPVPDQSRFDSGAFTPDELPAIPEPSRFAPQAPVRPQPLQSDSNQTADLLDALRRRRGERESAESPDESIMAAHPSTGNIRVIDVPMPTIEPEEAPSAPAAHAAPAAKESPKATLPQPPVNQTGPAPRVGRKGRVSMPSWDDIVFGAKPDDPA